MHLLEILITLIALLLLGMSLTPLLPAAFFDLPSHFVLQYLLAAGILLGAGALLRVPVKCLALPGLVVAVCLLHLLPFLMQKFGPTEAGGISLLQANVLKDNRDPAPLEKLIATEKPDVVILAEVTPLFALLAEDVKKDYPHQVVRAANGSFGIAVLSRLPLHHTQVHHFARADIPAISFTVEKDGMNYPFIALHAANPVRDLAARDAEFAAIAAHVKGKPVILAGDFNATPFCPAMKKLSRGSNLGYLLPITGSYPIWLPGPLRLPIDHLLATPEFSAHLLRTDDIGSDHLALTSYLYSHATTQKNNMS